MKISVLGCGWLGLPLAQELVMSGHSVKGSTTTADKLRTMKDYGIEPYMLDLNDRKSNNNVFLDNSDLLIINVPPKTSLTHQPNYLEKMTRLADDVSTSSVNKVIFVSSTSVYSDKNADVTESTLPDPSTDSAKLLLESENVFIRNQDFVTTVLRFGGLIGKDRHPVFSMAGKTQLKNPDAPVNLIQQEDCIQLILEIINNSAFGEVFNAAAPDHPTREYYYSKKANELGVSIPIFDHSAASVGKTISSEKVTATFNFKFSTI